jgi:hypothetical protein
VLCVFLLCCLPAVLSSCDLFDFDKPSTDSLEALGSNEFYAQNFVTQEYYKVKTEYFMSGEYCTIWIENDCGITKEKAEEIANEYDTLIRPRILNAFDKKNSIDNFNDILEYANWLADGPTDNKLTILLLDIQDGFKDPKTDSYVAGYFHSVNFYRRGKIPGTEVYSNGRDMIYIDTYPGLIKPDNKGYDPEQGYATCAHELQHLINYVTTRRSPRSYMDTWIDEGLSSQAEHIYRGTYSDDKVKWFIKDKCGTIAKGNNFFIWDNHTTETPLAILDDYASVYLFFRWLYLQADAALKSNIFYEIETSTRSDYRAVTDIAKEINTDWENWEALLRTWLAANYYPKNADYGYKGDSDFHEIKVKPIAGTSATLYPGEGVYSIINSSSAPNFTGPGNIRYTGLTDNSPVIDTSIPYQGDVLLTFNSNTELSDPPTVETGYLTNVILPVPPSRMVEKDAAVTEYTGPYVIDARDLLGRQEWNINQ